MRGSLRQIAKAVGDSMDTATRIAQVYNHIILPLANQRDKITQIRWGKEDFRSRFGRESRRNVVGRSSGRLSYPRSTN